MPELRPYQQESVTHLYEQDQAMVLASVGAGKTAIAITGADELVRDGIVKRWLVFAPRKVCVDVWPEELAKWAPHLTISVATGEVQTRTGKYRPMNAKERQKAMDADVDIVVVNYDAIQSISDISRFDGIIFDELTKLKNSSGKRFRHLEALIKDAGIKIRWGLTGSFTSAGLEDVFGQCRIVDRAILGRSKTKFLQEYFVLVDKDFGLWEPRNDSLPKVMSLIKPITYVLSNESYRDKLPPCHFIPVPCDFERNERILYEQMRKEYLTYIHGTKITAINAGVVSGKLSQMAGGFAYDKQHGSHWFSHHKFEALDDILEENQRAPTLILYNYKEELEELKRRYGNRLSTIKTPNVVKRWNAGEIELLALHPKSAGHGLNLQYGGCHMVFISLPWSLELFEQVVGRLHRGGQTNAVWVYFLQTKNTIDEKIWSRIINRQRLSNIALEELEKCD